MTDSKKLFKSEEHHMNTVYQAFDAKRKEAANDVTNKSQEVSAGIFDDHDAFIAHGTLSKAFKKQHETESLIQSIFEKPYFAHIEAKFNSGGTQHFFLSDNESLNETINIGDSGWLLPFKVDPNKPISKAMYRCYSAKDGKPIEYQVTSENPPYRITRSTIQPLLICDDEIIKRELLGINLLFSLGGDFEDEIDADELLSKILEENRNNPELRNIIRTLQEKQFEIIAADTKQSFVVQGCAGSGKSQCLLHRLFYLREELAQQGWENVVLITPTQLFRNYSANLVKRYQLDGITDCSISELYHSLLQIFDPRFKNRQYEVQLSEEYLPDDYLNEIYSDSTISMIDTEIKSAIQSYVSRACDVLRIDVPDTIDIDTIHDLIDSLDKEIQELDWVETRLKNAPVYLELKSEKDTLLKEVKETERKLHKLDLELSECSENAEGLQKLIDSKNEAVEERSSWIQQREQRISNARDKLNESIQDVESTNTIASVIQHANALYCVKEITSGSLFKDDENYLAFLNEYCKQAEKDLESLSKKGKPETILNKYRDKLSDGKTKRATLVSNLADLNERLSLCEFRISETVEALKGIQVQSDISRNELEKARYYLSRIETTVFEQEIWSALSEFKEQYSVKSMIVEKTETGHNREIKILYKSDLLFYIKLYSELYPNAELPRYSLFCIDEAQDLHKADYDILRRLFPKARFNIFGDTEQVLHSNCGVHNWEKDTGVSKVYSLNKNYRNTAATVEFCNHHFESNMQSIGKVKTDQKPKKLTYRYELMDAIDSGDVSIIVKDYDSFTEFSQFLGPDYDFEYLDTTAIEPDHRKISCYSVFAAKGLEFSNVIVYSKHMTKNQKIVACTRAMERLYYYE